MPLSTCLVAGPKGHALEVEQVDVFQHCIGDQEFNIAVHPEPAAMCVPSQRPLVVSLYETGCKLAVVHSDVIDTLLYGAVSRLGSDGVRPLARQSIQSLESEIGTARLAKLLTISLAENRLLNA